MHRHRELGTIDNRWPAQTCFAEEVAAILMSDNRSCDIHLQRNYPMPRCRKLPRATYGQVMRAVYRSVPVPGG